MEKLNSAIEFYSVKLKRKEKFLNELSERISNGEELTLVESEKRNILIAEISLIKGFISELEELK